MTLPAPMDAPPMLRTRHCLNVYSTDLPECFQD